MKWEWEWENATKNITLGQAIEMYKLGIALEVNNGKEITFVIEKEPIAGKQNRS